MATTPNSGNTKRFRLGQKWDGTAARPLGAILIVDDNKEEAFLARRVLEKINVINPIHAVLSGVQMITYLEGRVPFEDRQAHPYPILILLDLQMPGMDGFAVLQWLKDHPEHKIPICSMTGVKQLGLVHKAYQLGARSFVFKPMGEADFLTTVTSLKLGVDIKKNPPAETGIGGVF
jgi:CheY-like chemotaxis protein